VVRMAGDTMILLSREPEDSDARAPRRTLLLRTR
jgi:hypothetical protein